MWQSSIFTSSPTSIVATMGGLFLLFKIFTCLVQRSPLDNIPGPEPVSWWKGNLGYFYDRNGWHFLDRLDTYNGVARVDGLFGAKLLYVFDPTALQHIVTKDQHHYEPAAWFTASVRQTIGPGLLATLGDHHRKQRKMLNPVFSIAHMRDMSPIFYKIAYKLRDAVATQVKDGPRSVNILDWMGRTALELIGQGGLGYSFDPLTEDIPNAFGQAMKAFVPAIFTLGPIRFLTPYVTFVERLSFKRTIIDNIPLPTFQKVLKLVATIDQSTKAVYEGKKAALATGDEAVKEQIGEGKDIMSILLRENMLASEADRLGEDELLGQMTTLIFAATDTTSGALTQILHLLAEHPDTQERVRAEVKAALQDRDGDIPYDEIVSLPYMDAVCRETLRLYPPVPYLYRQANQTTSISLSQPIPGSDGILMKDITIPKDTITIIGIRSCNRNKAIWGEDALEWKPERWLSPLPDAVIDARVPGVYSNLMTFFGGGRSCIGFKFSQLEMKIVLAVLLGSFKFSMAEEMKEKVVWNLASIRYPTVGKDTIHASFPLRVERLAE